MLLAASETMELADGVGRGFEGRGGGGGFFLFPLLMFGLLGFLLFRLMRRGRRGAFAMGGGAMGTLSDRFARGEISRDEFEYRRAILNNDKDVPPAPTYTSPPAPSETGHTPPPAPSTETYGTPPGPPTGDDPVDDPYTASPDDDDPQAG